MWWHPEIRTLADVVWHWADRTPEAIALRTTHSALSYGGLASAVSDLAQTLLAKESEPGAGPSGANVCFIGKNVPEFWETWFAASAAGRAFVPLNWRCAPAELVDLITDCRPDVVFTDREYAELMADVVSRVRFDVEVIVFDSRGSGGAGLGSWSERTDTDRPSPRVTGEDIALIAYTSGTTGAPKGVMIRHEAFDLFALSDELEPTITWSVDDVALMVMPNFHLAGSWVSLPALYHGGTVAMIPAFEPAAVLRAVELFQPTVLCLVPTAIAALVSSDAVSTTDFSSLRTLIYAGSPIAAETIDRAVDALGCELRQFYGTSETYIITILRPADHHSSDPALAHLKASCGAPVPLVSVRVVDPDGREVVDGEVGQVLVRSPMVMAGYFNKPEETAAVLRDGWYWTGDLGFREPTGHHFLVDRVKDMVVTGGENVYSVEVERALLTHPAVAMAAVVGVPHDRWGEAVTAYVVPHPGKGGEDTGVFADELTRHCRGLIAAYKVPKAVHIETALPMTPMGKVRKVDLRARVGDAYEGER